jgi:dipeptidyl aminopeptidase/acylaminoacyl peptidase
MGDVFVLRDGAWVQRTDFGRLITEGTTLLPMHELTATAPDGYPVHGWLVRPSGDGPHPVLLVIHGGPFTQFGYTLFDEAQVYASAGYAVVMGNPRGSAGYGEAHGRAIVGDMGNRDRADLMALLDVALDQPGLDAARVGVMGGSYGGYMSAWLAAHEGSSRFKAAIVERALTAWDSFEGSSDIGWAFGDLYVGTDPDKLRDQSPLTHADKIDLPVLIIHSENDWRCPVEQGQRLFVRLRRNGVDAELLLFPGEGHELSRSGLPSHRVARFDAILDWWARHL